MGNEEKLALKRLGRGVFGLLISGVSFFISNNPATLVIAPVVNAVGKWLRSKFNLRNIPF